MKAVLITPSTTVTDDTDTNEAWTHTPTASRGFGVKAWPTRTETLTGGLGKMLDSVSGAFGADGGVILLDGPAARAYRLPTEGTEPPGGYLTTPGLDDARLAGWQTRNLSHGWAKFRKDGKPTIRLGVRPLIAGDNPLIGPNVPGVDAVSTLALWHETIGTPWYGSPGVAGQDNLEPVLKARKYRVILSTGAGKFPAGMAEADFSTAWRSPGTEPYEFGIDCNRMYLAALAQVHVAGASLKHTGKQDFDPKKAGWWLVDLSPWTIPDLPHPAGPVPGSALSNGFTAERRWLTTPTLALLAQLAEQGVYGGFTVVDSFTSFGSRLFREWGTAMEHAFMSMEKLAGETADESPTSRAQDAQRVAAAVKRAAAREVPGLWNAGGGSVRPDWWFALIGLARSNLFRKVWKAYQDGRAPLRIDVDNVWYGAPDADVEAHVPAPFTLGPAYGEFKVKKVIKIGAPSA